MSIQESHNDANPGISTVSQTINNTQRRIGRISRTVSFIVCGSCYWAASYLDGRKAERCLACQSVNIDSLPVAGNEEYMYDYDTERGIIVDFGHARTSE